MVDPRTKKRNSIRRKKYFVIVTKTNVLKEPDKVRIFTKV